MEHTHWEANSNSQRIMLGLTERDRSLGGSVTSMCQGSHYGENGLIIYMLDLEDSLGLREMGKGQGYSRDDHQDKQRLRVRNVLCRFKNTQEDSMLENPEQSPWRGWIGGQVFWTPGCGVQRAIGHRDKMEDGKPGCGDCWRLFRGTRCEPLWSEWSLEEELEKERPLLPLPTKWHHRPGQAWVRQKSGRVWLRS